MNYHVGDKASTKRDLHINGTIIPKGSVGTITAVYPPIESYAMDFSNINNVKVHESDLN